MNNSLTKAVISNNLPLVRQLLDNGADIHANNDLALTMASIRGNVDMVRELINRGANVHAKNDLPLIIAVQYGRIPIIEELLNSGVDIHTRDDQALITACGTGRVATVRYLLDQGANIHARGDLALILTTKYNHYLPVIEELLSRGADINVLSPEKRDQYQHLVPNIITVQEYYQIEPLSENITQFSDRYIIYIKTGTYSLQSIR